MWPSKCWRRLKRNNDETRGSGQRARAAVDRPHAHTSHATIQDAHHSRAARAPGSTGQQAETWHEAAAVAACLWHCALRRQ